jgi:hypothetical protein
MLFTQIGRKMHKKKRLFSAEHILNIIYCTTLLMKEFQFLLFWLLNLHGGINFKLSTTLYASQKSELPPLNLEFS